MLVLFLGRSIVLLGVLCIVGVLKFGFMPVAMIVVSYFVLSCLGVCDHAKVPIGENLSNILRFLFWLRLYK